MNLFDFVWCDMIVFAASTKQLKDFLLIGFSVRTEAKITRVLPSES